jgi:hypothetical protein
MPLLPLVLRLWTLAAAAAGHRGRATVGERLAARDVAESHNATVEFAAVEGLDTPTTHYRARASGPALVVGVAARVGDRVVARFAAPLAGAYFVEVLRLWDADVASLLETEAAPARYPCARAPPAATAFAGRAFLAAAPRPFGTRPPRAWVDAAGAGAAVRTSVESNRRFGSTRLARSKRGLFGSF